MTPADLRTLMATAERQPGETTEQYNARHDAEHQLSSWRVWLPGLLLKVETAPAAREVLEHFGRRLDQCPDDTPDSAFASVEMTHGEVRAVRAAILSLFLLPITPASQASGGAPAAVRSLPAGAHFPEVTR